MRSHPFRRRRRRLVIPIATVSSMAAVLLAAAAAPALVLGAASGATVTAAAPKAALHGLVDRQGPPAAATLSYVQAYVVKVNWADLQPTPLGPIVAGNRIDQAIARVRMPDMAGHVALKLRVFAGIGAPEWAKSIGGDPLPYLN